MIQNVRTNRTETYSPDTEVRNRELRSIENQTQTGLNLEAHRIGIFEVNKANIQGLKQQYVRLKRAARGGKGKDAKEALKIVRTDIDNIIQKINRIENKFKSLNRLTNADFSVYAKELKDYKNLIDWGAIEDAIQQASLGKKVKIWSPIHSPSDARQAQSREAVVARDNVEKQALLRNILALHLFNDKSASLESFINGAMSEAERFAFIQENYDSFQRLQQTNKAVYDTLVKETQFESFYSGHLASSANRIAYPAGGRRKEGSEYNSLGEATANAGIFWALDYLTKDIQSQDPKSQKFYRIAGNLALAAGGLFLAWKGVSTLWYKMFWSPEKKAAANWGRVAAPAALLLATGGNPAQIFRGGEFTRRIGDWIQNWGNKDSSSTAIPSGSTNRSSTSNIDRSNPRTREEIESEQAAQLLHGTAVPGTMAIVSDMTYWELWGILEKRNDVYRIKPNAYQQKLNERRTQLADTSNNLTSRARTQLEWKIRYLEQLGEKDEKMLLHQGLKEMWLIGIMERDPRSTKKIEKDVERYIGRLLNIGDVDLDSISQDPLKEELLTSYRQTGTPSLQRLKEMWIFIEDTAHTQAQISKLWLSLDESYLAQKACNEIYATYRDYAKDKGIHLEKDSNNTLLFKTYDKQLKINLNSKTLEGFKGSDGYDVKFTDIGELIKAANLINVIKYHSKDMVATNDKDSNGNPKHKDEHPFYLDALKNLTFRGTGDDNTVMATGTPAPLNWLPRFNNAIKDNSPTLDEHKSDLVTYLNTTTPPFWRPNIQNTP